jgi:putative thioredoxin
MNNDVLDFDRDVLERSRTVPVLVDFWAPWCGPCKALGPILEKLEAESDGRWVLVKVNTDEQTGLAEAYQISSIPNVKLFRHGAVVDQFLGYKSEAEVCHWIERHLPSASTQRLEKAAELIDNGDVAGARKLLEEALAEEPSRAAAKLLFAELLLGDDPARAIKLTHEIPPDAEEAPHAEALGCLAAAAQRSVDSVPDDPLRPKLLEGLDALRSRDWETALASFTEVVESRRDFAEALAAETGKAIFRYLGIRHPVAEKYHRRFSSAVNA